MRHRRGLTTVAALMALITTAGCAAPASQRYVAFPVRGQDQGQQAYDVQECEAIADGKRGPEAQEALLGGTIGALGGAAVGAASSAIIGAMLTGAAGNIGPGAGIGALMGLVAGTVQAVRQNRARYDSLFQACLSSKGYTVGGG